MSLTLDRLPDPGEPARVLVLDGLTFGDGRGHVREPHRHDYHELLWIRSGGGQQLLDGRVEPVRPGSVTLIGRGQVHVFERADDVHGAVVRFRDELLLGAAERATPGWLLAGRGARTVPVPAGEAGRLEATIGALAAELERPPDGESAELQRHLISVLMLWVERWYDAVRVERRDADDAEVQLHRRFTGLLERDFAHQHEAGAYADALGVPAAALSRALSEVTGRATKELIIDRVMLEAARLLRYTDLSVQEVARRTGYGDPLYFSRAFKRQLGQAPMAYREGSRAPGVGKSMHP
ncbi:MAG TPA: AraC family transcriptional regulator [Thermoleophilaceae bacterium]